MPPQNQERRSSLLVELLKFLVLAVIIVAPVRLFVAKPYVVSGSSMEPTFKDGQYLIIDELTYHFEVPQRGDVIVFRYPRNPSQFFIKRIIGLPNETVTISGGAISVKEASGQNVVLDESYVVNQGNGSDATYTLGGDEYFVLGDNRPASSDSRVWGPLPRTNIVGRVFVRLLPITSVSIFPGKAQLP
ncbi:MAG: signal peptidase I [Patescibacteria group bacterium]|nr:signal peptidase I [Patescibacteria group bacterium]